MPNQRRAGDVQPSPTHKIVPSTAKATTSNNFNPQPQAGKNVLVQERPSVKQDSFRQHEQQQHAHGSTLSPTTSSSKKREKPRTKFPIKSLGNNLRMYVDLMTGMQSTRGSGPSPLSMPAPYLPTTPTSPEDTAKTSPSSKSRAAAHIRNITTNASVLIARGIISPRSRDATKAGKHSPTIHRTPSIALTDDARHTLLKRGNSALARVDGPCTGGVYTLQHKREEGGAVVAVFKPEDEETGSGEGKVRCGEPNPERAGMVVGGGARRERAAYVLDRQAGHFSGVPPTQLACITTNTQQSNTVSHDTGRSRRGSIQRFCPNDGSVEDRYDLLRRASVLQAQRVGMLDMRIFNTDRHGGNVLCTEVRSTPSSSSSLSSLSLFSLTSPSNNNQAVEEEEQAQRQQEQQQEEEQQQQEPADDNDEDEESPVTLVPIDHALTLPDWQHLGEAYLDWGMWPQAHEPWHPSVTAAVAALNPTEDAQQLRELEIRESSIATMEICTTVLKAGVLKGGIRSLADGAKLFERPFTAGHARHAGSRSALELIVERAAAACGMMYPDHNASAVNERPPDRFFVALDEQLDELMPNQKWKSLEICETEEPDKSTS